MDMAPDAFDDLYKGCREEAMEKFIHSDLLKEELEHTEAFKKAWIGSKCPKTIPSGIKEHTAALSAYANGDVDFKNAFDDAVMTVGNNVSTYKKDFYFKSLHFLLMDALNLLKPKTCKNVYSVTEKENKVQNGSNVRFGKFTTGHLTYSSLKKETDLDGMTVFIISSCFFVNLEDNACIKDEALISPAEVFTVEEVKKVNEEDSEYTEIVLKHSEILSEHNCYIFSR